jgi:hypothetical protein
MVAITFFFGFGCIGSKNVKGKEYSTNDFPYLPLNM